MCFSPRRIPKHLLFEQPARHSFLQRHWVKLVGYTTFLLLGLALSDLVHAGADQDPIRQPNVEMALAVCSYAEKKSI